jgi:hypothetical protein
MVASRFTTTCKALTCAMTCTIAWNVRWSVQEHSASGYLKGAPRSTEVSAALENAVFRRLSGRCQGKLFPMCDDPTWSRAKSEHDIVTKVTPLFRELT